MGLQVKQAQIARLPKSSIRQFFCFLQKEVNSAIPGSLSFLSVDKLSLEEKSHAQVFKYHLCPTDAGRCLFDSNSGGSRIQCQIERRWGQCPPEFQRSLYCPDVERSDG